MTTSQQASTSTLRTSERALLALGVIGGVTCLIALWFRLPVLQVVSGEVPVLCTVIWLSRRPHSRFASLILTGLIASMIANLLMWLEPALLLAGLLTFVAAQIIYSIAFVGVTRRGSWVRLVPFVAWGLIAYLVLAQNANPPLEAGNLSLPMAAYITVVVVMMWRAAALIGAQGKTREFEVAATLGALTLGLSNTLTALNRFIWHDTFTYFNAQHFVPFISMLAIILYWLAQWVLGLAAGWEASDRI
jgi:alkenylglycerophosphocholine/alkenylglycerophosphoethanolamine hydrolase